MTHHFANSAGARASGGLAKLLARLIEQPHLRLVANGDGEYDLTDEDRKTRYSERTIRPLLSSGLLHEAEPGQFAAGQTARAWLKRRLLPEEGFRSQHQALQSTQLADGSAVLVNRDESPVATLARQVKRNGEPWLPPHAVAAAERLRRDFEVGQLQPRVTANWSASVNRGRRTGDGVGLTELTDAALAARTRFGQAMDAVGPEFSGVIADVCCFLKGLETVERERQWPARSAKLVLRLALESLARQYGLAPAATGAASRRGVHHWGAEDYRPKLS